VKFVFNKLIASGVRVMNEVTKQNVDSSSAKFEEGVEAGLNSTKDSKDWKAGNELGQELKAMDEKPAFSGAVKESSTPLFASRNPGSNQGNDQDEKDGTEE
jgi:hypothetical protein